MNQVEIGKVYRHFKGKYYYIKDIGIHSENGNEYVVYQGLYGDYQTFIKPLSMFIEEVDLNRLDNTTGQKYRLEKQEL